MPFFRSYYQNYKKMKQLRPLLFALTFVCNSSCVDSFEPNIKGGQSNLLVVEGALLYGGDTTSIKLSRSTSLAKSATIQPELFATVKVMDTEGHAQLLNSKENGIYASVLDLNLSKDYFLSIETESGKRYRSEIIKTKVTPPVDSLTWNKISSNEIEFYIYTHDPTGNTKYYKWDYIETWQIKAPRESKIQYVDGELIPRSPEEQISVCWNSDYSKSIQLGTTAPLAQDVIFKKPILKVQNDIRLSSRYSVLLNQYALTEEAYNYFENIEKINEELGSFFDTQPNEPSGNIYALDNPNETVIGYVFGSSVEKIRVFVTSFGNSHTLCSDTVIVIGYPIPQAELEELFSDNEYIPLYINEEPVPTLTYTIEDCTDCRVYGSATKPSFWKD